METSSRECPSSSTTARRAKRSSSQFWDSRLPLQPESGCPNSGHSARWRTHDADHVKSHQAGPWSAPLWRQRGCSGPAPVSTTSRIGGACRKAICKGFGSINQLSPLWRINRHRAIPTTFRADADGQVAALIRQMRPQHDAFLYPQTKLKLELCLKRDTFIQGAQVIEFLLNANAVYFPSFCPEY